ncbi:MAG: NAD(P)H-binding protein, partial [bacterium]
MILITGSNGYVGMHLVERLCGEGLAVRALVRRGCSIDEKAFLTKAGAEVCEADLEEEAVMLRAMEGVHTVVHLLGSIERPSRGGYRGMHTQKTGLMLRAFKAALSGAEKVGRVIYLSAIGAARGAGNQYSQTKWEAEEEIRRSGLDYIIIRSSLIFGRETGTRDSKIVKKLMRVSAERKAVPLVRSGRNRLQPIYVGDLVSCITHAIAVPSGCRDVWEVGGPEVLTLSDVTSLLIKMRGLQRRFVGVPYPVAFLAGLVARGLRCEGTLNLEQIRMSRCDTICTRNKAESILGDRLTGFEDGMAKTIARFGPGARPSNGLCCVASRLRAAQG